MRFPDKTVFVTGGGSGIGGAVSQAFAIEGARVAIADLNFTHAKKVADEITSKGGKAIAISLDVSSAESVDAAFSRAEAWYGETTNVLVNSAGIIGINAFLDYTLAQFQQVMAVNVTGAFICAQRAARSMVKANAGHIVNVASVSAERAGVGRIAYGTSKAAMVGLTRQLAMELGPYGVTANSIAPGPVLTPMTAASYTTETIDAYTSMIPARRLGTLDEMTNAILFLASDHARYINGIFMPVDGGYLAGGVNKTGKIS
ncbi:SDR family NAD(P)-dependent oxidoreductase [Pragia fontium]|uniref:SDR family NAD(P)-dependent oxidoreductase n=1 Tax=Pragia fontium TaxID=82985 RepID=UPI0006495D02|nr:SDR family NAD(P)-dependent oxidoreductase [Pragia fontium]AKJ42164.1 oxidoreductase [Pragia fontium]